ncbi:MAG: 4-hydroxy-tetrahydrodipicolinate reductase [Planctomycetales bacterium]|nr:4-hydroxy-tetrahydrodipicolinate reductase [Planctomycetales bacterium]NIM09323.1 4-hydroxy-tetrahydrodipicolinate reductase [Planctomycetales bacterium]NIN08791.1 4-hydroxy-tetrahydrodipicolinate reductase [Planctomycetales bacterium]NIN77908.1 4-hydroxy-tetrahydrodipicolinate reductase [Planctomycetales bacterium]NIO35091.1 4-hydroxy-tetrahydrodipicolinate reductase [Planctomycetales bacterium]
MAIKLAIHGAAGRMGQRLIALGAEDPNLQIVAALEARKHPRLGEDAGQVAGVAPLNLPLSCSWDGKLDVVIDFSVPKAALHITRLCLDSGIPLVLATTGLTEREENEVRQAAKKIPLLWAPNMSLAVNLTMKLAEITAETLSKQDEQVDVEILERHHRFKEDAPSGTALAFGKRIAAVMGQTEHRHGREGRVGIRPRSEIGYHAIRVGDNPGEHTIVFGTLGETVELRVAATHRDAYALGALAAAKFLNGKPPGAYTMNDVLGL